MMIFIPTPDTNNEGIYRGHLAIVLPFELTEFKRKYKSNEFPLTLRSDIGDWCKLNLQQYEISVEKEERIGPLLNISRLPTLAILWFKHDSDFIAFKLRWL